ncbi:MULTISPECIES: ABC transporter permease [unclassified Oceanispirochaeta]|uniref:ABC transporter permease n=1 Tax=unclassified Oceanispirochaeta TaxID=2635722 RepID=UPI000E090FB9|nr:MULTISPECIES: ABC transporter permease [unclassified Oceanispirochaeta]MBF9014613.1 ABC transporter permease [Oceanispirochaeta sp. M2]NPD70869.1 ABC transporter permease [Oceanispirochaeta sp. M1]RDG34148.1 ABC transporter permease [Oceanispirochaeta sp. M1]
MSNSYAKTISLKQNKYSISRSGIVQFIRENMGILIGLTLLCVILAFQSPVFLSKNNVLNVLRQVATNLYIACAMTMIIILGGIDLSVGSIIALSGVVTGGMMAFDGASLVFAVICGLAVGLLVGGFNGYVISTTTIPPFIVTLATMNIARGAAYVYTGGQPIRVMSDSFNFIGAGYLGEIPMPIIYLVAIVLLSVFIMSKSKLGRHIYAVGGNHQAALFSGIKTKRVTFFAYTFSGLMAAIAGIVLASRMFSGQPTAGQGAEMDAIAAVVLGGTSMSGGAGKIGGTVIGALVIGVLSNGLNLMGINSFWQYIVKGVVILIAVYVDCFKKKTK